MDRLGNSFLNSIRCLLTLHMLFLVELPTALSQEELCGSFSNIDELLSPNRKIFNEEIQNCINFSVQCSNETRNTTISWKRFANADRNDCLRIIWGYKATTIDNYSPIGVYEYVAEIHQEQQVTDLSSGDHEFFACAVSIDNHVRPLPGKTTCKDVNGNVSLSTREFASVTTSLMNILPSTTVPRLTSTQSLNTGTEFSTIPNDQSTSITATNLLSIAISSLNVLPSETTTATSPTTEKEFIATQNDFSGYIISVVSIPCLCLLCAPLLLYFMCIQRRKFILRKNSQFKDLECDIIKENLSKSLQMPIYSSTITICKDLEFKAKQDLTLEDSLLTHEKQYQSDEGYSTSTYSIDGPVDETGVGDTCSSTIMFYIERPVNEASVQNTSSAVAFMECTSTASSVANKGDFTSTCKEYEQSHLTAVQGNLDGYLRESTTNTHLNDFNEDIFDEVLSMYEYDEI